MKTSILYSGFWVIFVCLLSLGCQKDKSCEAIAISSLAGVWEGTITTSMLQDGIQQFETIENATVTFNSDYTGDIRKIRTFNNSPIDTTLELFEFSFVPEAHLLDIVIESTGTPQNPENANYSQVYDILNLDDELEVLHERNSADINGVLSEFSIHWKLDRQ
ncbi:MAG: hypothetical protein KDD02_13500 [Phaeodactylibacter sp.]|nr:hypothetical protein [Phaeodactylibacter sp.]MCB2092679.1 hypothetical protein [Alphaproteobacteria bacterium]MCB9300897.1 hypothetical protein [Lewinellaceae bacterium]